jgi:hypothetical protein
MEKQSQPQQKIVGYSEFIGLIIAFASAALIFWKTTDVRLSALELRMAMKEKSEDVINAKLDKLQEGVNDLKITIQNKQDKK